MAWVTDLCWSFWLCGIYSNLDDMIYIQFWLTVSLRVNSVHQSNQLKYIVLQKKGRRTIWKISQRNKITIYFSGCQNFEWQDLFSLSKRLSEAAIKFSLSGRNCRGETEYITMSNLEKVGGVVWMWRLPKTDDNVNIEHSAMVLVSWSHIAVGLTDCEDQFANGN